MGNGRLLRGIGFLVGVIKKKRELQGISDSIVKEKLMCYLKQNPKLKLENKRSSDYKKAIKEVRVTLRRHYGLFRKENINEDINRYFSDIRKMLNIRTSSPRINSIRKLMVENMKKPT